MLSINSPTPTPANLHPQYVLGMLATRARGFDIQWSTGHVARILREDEIVSARLYRTDSDGFLTLAFNVGGMGGDGQKIARDATDDEIFAMAFGSPQLDRADRADCLAAQAQYREASGRPQTEVVATEHHIPANLWARDRLQMQMDIARGLEPVWSTDHLCRLFRGDELKGAEVFYIAADGDLMRAFSVGHAGGDGQDIPADATDEALFDMALDSADADKSERRAIKRAYTQYCAAAGIKEPRPSRKELKASIKELTARVAELEKQLAA